MIGYKLLSYERGALFSWSPPQDGKVSYQRGETTFPKSGCGPLFVIRTLEDMEKYENIAAKSYPHEIWKVEYEPSHHCHAWTRNQQPEHMDNFFHGTAFADSITLLERIG